MIFVPGGRNPYHPRISLCFRWFELILNFTILFHDKSCLGKSTFNNLPPPQKKRSFFLFFFGGGGQIFRIKLWIFRLWPRKFVLAWLWGRTDLPDKNRPIIGHLWLPFRFWIFKKSLTFAHIREISRLFFSKSDFWAKSTKNDKK